MRCFNPVYTYIHEFTHLADPSSENIYRFIPFKIYYVKLIPNMKIYSHQWINPSHLNIWNKNNELNLNKFEN